MNKKLDPSKIKALAIDLDGTTLMPDTTLGVRTQKIFHKLIERGMQIIIATGRAVEASWKIINAIGAEGPMVFFNGAEVADLPSGKVLSVNLVRNDIMDFCVDIARSMNIYFQIYLQAGISPNTGKNDPVQNCTAQSWEALVIEKAGEESELYQRHTGIVPVVKDLKTVIAAPEMRIIKGMYIADPSLHDELRQKLNERFNNQINILRSFPAFLEILNAGVSKGEGLKTAMLHRGLKPEEVIAFGDEENDLSMFEAVGFCGAPTGARDKIRRAADFTYPSIEEEGLAAYLEETFL